MDSTAPRSATPGSGTPGRESGATPTGNGSSRPSGVTTPRATTGVPPAPRPGSADDDTRRVKLTVSRIDPFSVLKISFLLSVALGIAGVVAVAVLWGMLNGMGVFSTITESVNELQAGAAETSRLEVGDWFGFGRVVALAVVFGTIDLLLLTALSTLAAFIYNVCATLIGGVQVTLSDD